jgi:hypothetical protein
MKAKYKEKEKIVDHGPGPLELRAPSNHWNPGSYASVPYHAVTWDYHMQMHYTGPYYTSGFHYNSGNILINPLKLF